MVARAIPEAEVERLAARGTAELRARFSAAGVEAPPPVNVANAVALVDGEHLEYRGAVFPVRPISAMDGLRLMEIGARLEAAKTAPDPMRELRRCYADVLRTVHRLISAPGWRRWLWRLRPNPFRDATVEEVKAILGFCDRCQTTSSVRYRSQPTDSRSDPRTSSR